jgi:hypothetical protein
VRESRKTFKGAIQITNSFNLISSPREGEPIRTGPSTLAQSTVTKQFYRTAKAAHLLCAAPIPSPRNTVGDAQRGMLRTSRRDHALIMAPYILARFRDPAMASSYSHLLVKYLLVLRHKIANACCGPSDERLDIVREAIITISGVEAGHGQEVFGDVTGQIVCTHDLVAH